MKNIPVFYFPVVFPSTVFFPEKFQKYSRKNFINI